MTILARLLSAVLVLLAPAARADIADAPSHAVPRSHQIDLVSSGGATYRILVARPAAPAPASG